MRKLNRLQEILDELQNSGTVLVCKANFYDQ